MSEERLQEAIEYNDKKTDEMIDEIVFTRWQDPTIEEKDKEIERLNNIINELEKDMNRDDLSYVETQYVLDKIKELKGEDKE